MLLQAEAGTLSSLVLERMPGLLLRHPLRSSSYTSGSSRPAACGSPCFRALKSWVMSGFIDAK
jgi:hypothetical protein